MRVTLTLTSSLAPPQTRAVAISTMVPLPPCLCSSQFHSCDRPTVTLTLTCTFPKMSISNPNPDLNYNTTGTLLRYKSRGYDRKNSPRRETPPRRYQTPQPEVLANPNPNRPATLTLTLTLTLTASMSMDAQISRVNLSVSFSASRVGLALAMFQSHSTVRDLHPEADVRVENSSH